MKNDLVKVYAAFRSGCLGSNILEAYFPFFVNIICDEGWEIIEETKVADHFERKYHISVPLAFVRQVLGIGLENNSIYYDRGKYRVEKDIICQYKFDSSSFDSNWDVLLKEFSSYCISQSYDLTTVKVENRILQWIEENDEVNIYNDDFAELDISNVFEYAWSKFVTEKAIANSDLIQFVASLSFSNVIKQAIFYTGKETDSFKGLNVYLDSPMVFALLGMDSESRVNSCKFLLEKLHSAKCNVYIFDHNFQEIDGIINRAAGWAVSNQYDFSKANNAVRYFHDSQMSETEIAEFCASLEKKISQMNISIKETNYNIGAASFQEDEELLVKMIENKYTNHGPMGTMYQVPRCLH